MEAKFLPPDLRAKLPQRNGAIQLSPETEDLVTGRLLRELQPLRAASKLGALLLQLSPAFRPKTSQLTELDSLRPHLDGIPLAVELRNRDWVTGDQLDDTLCWFRERRVTFVLVDAPASEHFTIMPGIDCVTNPALGYFRFHGRNEQGYIRGRSVAERFDYDYSDDEVKELAERIRKVALEVEELRVIANNNRSNYAPRLVERLAKLLNLERELQDELGEKQVRKREQQQTLF